MFKIHTIRILNLWWDSNNWPGLRLYHCSSRSESCWIFHIQNTCYILLSSVLVRDCVSESIHHYYFLFTMWFEYFWTDAYYGPENQAVLENDEVSFECQVSSQSNSDFLWIYNKAVGHRSILYMNSSLQENLNRSFLVSSRPDGHYNLTIKQATREYVGMYSCADRSRKYTAHLIVLGNCYYRNKYMIRFIFFYVVYFNGFIDFNDFRFYLLFMIVS